MTDTYGGPNLAPEAPPDLAPSAPVAAPQADPMSAVAGIPAAIGGALSSFGSSIKNLLPGPHYDTPDPATSALDQSAGLLDQRVKRANSIATNPLAQIFAPEQVQAAREFVPKAAEQLQKIQQQKAAIQAGRTQAQTLGLDPGEVSDQASDADRLEAARAKALKGDLRSFQGIAAVNPQAAAAIQDQVHEAVSSHVAKAQFAFDSLSAMESEGQYRDKVNELRQKGMLKDLESLGMKLPPTLDAFSNAKGAEGKALREARIAVEGLRARIEERTGGSPMEKKEAETYNGRLTTESGQPLSNVNWERINGKRVAVVNGMGDIRDLGKKFSFASPDQRKAIQENAKAAVPEKEIEKVRSFERIGTFAVTDPNGKFIPPEGLVDSKGRRTYMNTNPNIMQGLAEGFAAAFREGQGGATGGLLNIEASKRGAVQGLLDKLKSAYGGALNTLTGDQVRSYLTTMTEKQQRQVLDGLREYNAKTVSSRLSPIARQAGELGLDASALGLGKGEVQGVEDAIEAGRQSTIARFSPRARATSGGDGGIYLDNPPPVLITQPNDPNAVHPPVPPPVTPQQRQQTSGPQGGVQQPGAPQAPAPQPGAPGSPSPASGPGSGQPGGSSPAGGGTPQPVRVAGLDVNVPLPTGASPSYVTATQRIESGGERNPWTSTTKGSSASGAFQFIDSTWKENRPAGAPDRAKDATPEQQAQAFATLTAKNAAMLTNLKLPVNDTTLYMAHNVGPNSAAALLSASPMQDARSVVGEAAARNNPTFFKGRPNVATVLQRYAEAMNASDDGGSSLGSTVAGAVGRAARGIIPGGQVAGLIWDNLTPEMKQKVKDGLTDEAPAIGSIGGSVAGGLLGNVPGAIAGGAVGGGAGQSLKDWLKGNPQDPTEIAKQTALGGVLGVASEARPFVAAGARVVGAGAVNAGAEVAKGGDAEDVLNAAGTGMAESAGGEAFGRALGMAGHKVYSLFAPDARKAVQEAAKSYADAAEVLKTESPKLPGVGGAAGGANPKYDAAEAAKTKAEQTLKDAGLNPEEAAYAHRVSSEVSPRSRQEAQVEKPGALEQQNIGQGYQQLRSEVGDKGVGAVKAVPKPLQDGPITAVVSGAVPKAFAELATKVENAITEPAANWQVKWDQLKDARSALLEKEREAYASTGARKVETAEAYRALADTVRKQQEKASNYVFGPTEGPKVIDRLKVLDQRYRNLMEATNGGDLAKAATLKGEAGRDADRKFRAFASGDPAALEAWNAMRRTGANLEQGVHDLVAAERIPVLGRVFSGVKLLGSFNRWVAARQAGSPVKFADIIRQGDNGAKATRNAVGSAGARAAVQGDYDASGLAGMLP